MKKITPSIAIVLTISAYFVATQPITPSMAAVSSVSVLFFALPSYLAVVRLSGKKRAAVLLGLLGLYALFIESMAIKTGFPYGEFVYKDVLGNKIFSLTPWTVAFAYPPIILLTYWFARKRHAVHRTYKILFSTAFDAMLIDLVLDPAAVKLGFWYWDGGGFFYNVPLVNFLGWILTASIAATLVHAILRKQKNIPHAFAYSGLMVLWFWTWVNIWLGHIWPSILGCGLLWLFVRHIRSKAGILKQ
jgi:bisanhydrobacterioruberin hydratase